MVENTPSWLNKEFVEKVLRNSEADQTIQVIDVFIAPATNKGDNYGSEMLRVNVDLAKGKAHERMTEKISFVVKMYPQAEGFQRDMISQLKIFDTEISMMTKTLPKMNEILNKKNSFNARGLYMQKDDPVMLIMEDLAPLGYRMSDRAVGLDLPHSLIATQALAKFHASSIALCEKDPGQKEFYKKGTFDESYSSDYTKFYNNGVKSFLEELANWSELDPSIYHKVVKSNLLANIYMRGVEAVKCDRSEFNVINHGDCWINNMLFRYDENDKPIDHKFVDFQLSFYTSPAIDLYYFFNLSLNDEVLASYEKFLLDEYLKVLTNTMKEIGCKTVAPSAKEFEKCMNQRRMLAVIFSITILPVVKVDKSKHMTFDEMLNEDGANHDMYKNPLYRKVMCRRLPIFDKFGLFD